MPQRWVTLFIRSPAVISGVRRRQGPGRSARFVGGSRVNATRVSGSLCITDPGGSHPARISRRFPDFFGHTARYYPSQCSTDHPGKKKSASIRGERLTPWSNRPHEIHTSATCPVPANEGPRRCLVPSLETACRPVDYGLDATDIKRLNISSISETARKGQFHSRYAKSPGQSGHSVFPES